MWAAAGVERDPFADAGPGLAAIAVALEVDVLVFERAPQPLDEHVVHPAAASIHRDAHAGCRQRPGEEGMELAYYRCPAR
jgi:hypothetical protein